MLWEPGSAKQADALSMEMDKCLVNTEVDYAPPFDLNDSFDTIFTDYMEKRRLILKNLCPDGGHRRYGKPTRPGRPVQAQMNYNAAHHAKKACFDQ